MQAIMQPVAFHDLDPILCFLNGYLYKLNSLSDPSITLPSLTSHTPTSHHGSQKLHISVEYYHCPGMSFVLYREAI